MATQQAQQRADRKFKYGTPAQPQLRKSTRFRYIARLANGRNVELEHVLSCTWDDATAILTGTLTVAVPAFGERSAEQRLEKGDRVACLVSIGGAPYRHVWTMRVYKPEYHAADRQRTFQLANDLDLLRQSEDNFWFKKKDNRHPHGWTGPQIIREVCRRNGVPIGAIYGSTRSITKGAGIRVKRGSPLEVFRQVVYRENHRHRRRVFIRWHAGKLYVLPLRRSRNLLALGPTLIDAVLTSEMNEMFASAVTIHTLDEFKLADDAGGLPRNRLKKSHLYLESDVSRRLYGYVHRIIWSPDAKTTAALRAEGNAWLRAAAKEKRTLSLTHAGMPFLRRGDAIQVAIGDRAMRRAIVWTSHVTHQASPDAYTMDVEVTFDDPHISRRGQSILQKLKATHDDAVGNRARLDPLWYIPADNKGDIAPGGDPFPQVQDNYRRRLRGADTTGVGSGQGGPF